MGRTIRDADFQEWEVFASTGRGGYPKPAQIIFRNLSDRTQPSRFTHFEGDRSEAEEAVHDADAEQLAAWLAETRILDQDPARAP